MVVGKMGGTREGGSGVLYGGNIDGVGVGGWA